MLPCTYTQEVVARFYGPDEPIAPLEERGRAHSPLLLRLGGGSTPLIETEGSATPPYSLAGQPHSP